MQYLILIEKTATGYSAYSPDLDGCVATAPINPLCLRGHRLDRSDEEKVRVPISSLTNK